MRFREYDNLIPKIISSSTGKEIERQLEELSKIYEFVDLQFSDCNSTYSVLALLKKREEEENVQIG